MDSLQIITKTLIQKMKPKNKIVFIFILISISIKSFSQNDKTIELTQDDFLKMVRTFHPIAKQADLILKNANANKQAANGGFDPKLFYDTRNKFYDNTNYYNSSVGGLVIPTWYGVDFKLGYENNNGAFLNPENKLPSQGLLYSQISLPILQGLIIDERRATLKKAILFEKMSEFEKSNLLNELMYNAGKTYWNWQIAYSNFQVFKSSITIAQERFNAVKKTAELGDRPFIDTVEANIQLQERFLSYQQSQLEYQTQSLLLSNYLWMEKNIPLELSEKTIPESKSSANTTNYDVANNDESIFENQIKNHPVLKIYQYKLQQLEIEKKVKQDKLKPSLNLNYNPLFNPNNINFAPPLNNKWGLSFAFPLFLRKERGELKMAKIKIQNTQYENNNKQTEIVNKTKSIYIEFKSLIKQFDLYESTVKNYEKLWLAEKTMFDSGESSLFIINSREMSYINSQLKLNELYIKKKKAALELNYSLGILNTTY